MVVFVSHRLYRHLHVQDPYRNFNYIVVRSIKNLKFQFEFEIASIAQFLRFCFNFEEKYEQMVRLECELQIIIRLNLLINKIE